MAGKSSAVGKAVKKDRRQTTAEKKKRSAVGGSSQKSRSPRLTSKPTSEKLAFENARLLEENALLAESERERVAELQIINSIQQGLAAELDFQAIVDLVGDKLREVLNSNDLVINWYDEKNNLIHYLYYYEHGKKMSAAPRPPQKGGIFETHRKTRQPVIFNSLADYEKYNATVVEGTDQGKSYASVPVISSDRVLGAIGLENFERENAFGESELRLLTTIAASLGTALENARLFDETQRLFKAEQERVAELQIINSIQQGLAAELDFQAIVDLVGDKLREVLATPNLGIVWIEESQGVIHTLYAYEHNQRLTIAPVALPKTGRTVNIIATRKPVIFNTVKEMPNPIPGTDQAKSAIYVPIISKDRVIGILDIENFERENAFGESELRLLTTIAASLGTALENARLFDETQRLFKAEQERVAELQIINSIQQGLAAELDFQAIVDLVGDKLREVLNSGDIGIRWYDSKLNIISPLYEYEHNKRIHITPATPKKGGPFETLQTTKKPLVFNTAEEQNAFGLSVAPGTDQSKSTIYIPIIVSDSVIGYIITENHEREYAYGESEIRLLTTIAASLGTALENARLFDETQRLLKITEDRAAELAIINSVSEGLVRELDFQAIIDLVGEKIRKEFKVEDMYIALYDLKSNILTTPYYIEHGDRFPIEPREFRSASYAGWAITNRTTLVINENIEQRKLDIGIDASNLIGDDEEEDLTQSVLCAPIWSSGQVIGVITLYSNEANAFAESSVSLLTTLCANLGVALQNARLFDETQRLLKETEERAAELEAISTVTQALVAETDLDNMIQLIGSQMRNTFHADIRLYPK